MFIYFLHCKITVKKSLVLYTDYGYDNPNYRFAFPDENCVILIHIFVAIQIITVMDQIIRLDNVDQYNSLYGLETLHPLVSVVDLTKATRSVNHIHIQMQDGLPTVKYFADKICLSPAHPTNTGSNKHNHPS